jgi:hypothetical protein
MIPDGHDRRDASFFPLTGVPNERECSILKMPDVF